MGYCKNPKSCENDSEKEKLATIESKGLKGPQLEEKNEELDKIAKDMKETEEEEATEEVEKEEKEADKQEKRKVEDNVVEERFYTIPLGKAWISSRNKRAPKAIRLVKTFVQKHMKLRTEAGEEEETDKLVISDEVNRRIWSRGIQKPPRKVRVRAVKDREGMVTLYLAEGD